MNLEKCSKCFYFMKRRSVLASCGHRYHFECLKKLSDNNGVVNLPVCSNQNCKKTITSFLQHRNRTYDFRAGTTYKGESRPKKKKKLATDHHFK